MMNFWKMLTANQLMNTLQLLFWPSYLLLSYWGNGLIPENEREKFAFGEVVVVTFIQALFFYTLVFFLWKLAYAKHVGKWLGIVLATLALLLPTFVHLFQHMLPQWISLWVYDENNASAYEGLIYKIVQQYFHLGSLAGLFVYRHYSVHQEVVKHQAIKEKHRFERRFLTAAVDPHLLNSMLTNLKLELDNMKTEAASSLSKVVQSFADMIAYGLSYAKDAVLHVPLLEELKQAERYIAVQGFRLARTLPVSVISTGCIEAWSIPPVTLNTLLGDVFKYGIVTDTKHPVTLSVEAHPNKLTITCRNRIGNLVGKKVGIGLGIELIKRRVELAYPEQSTYKASLLPNNTYETMIAITKNDEA